jgi:TonB family protein
VEVVNGDPVLVKEAEQAAKEWKFKAWQYMDLPIRSWARIAFNFQLPLASSAAPSVTGKVVESGGLGDAVWVSPLVIRGKLVKQVMPKYPKDARKHKIQGTVTLQITISKEGAVEDVKAESGPSELVGAAEEAVRQWKFKPPLLLGQPIRVKSKVMVNFVLY